LLGIRSRIRLNERQTVEAGTAGRGCCQSATAASDVPTESSRAESGSITEDLSRTFAHQDDRRVMGRWNFDEFSVSSVGSGPRGTHTRWSPLDRWVAPTVLHADRVL